MASVVSVSVIFSAMHCGVTVETELSLEVSTFAGTEVAVALLSGYQLENEFQFAGDAAGNMKLVMDKLVSAKAWRSQ